MNRSATSLASRVAAFLLVISWLHAQPSQLEPRGIGGGGALFSPSVSPYNGSELYVACDMTQLFHSTDLGESWSVVDFRQLQVGNIYGNVQFTSDPKILYTLDARTEVGMPVRSTDGGTTWKPLATDPTDGGAFSLYADPASTTNILLSDYSTLYYSTDGGATFTPKFTTDSANGCYVAGAFFDGNRIFVGTNQGLIASTDGGSTFSRLPITGIPQSEAIVSFAGAKQNGKIRFFCVTIGSGDLYPGTDITGVLYDSYQGVYSVDEGSFVWAKKIGGIASGTYPFFVAMAKNNTDIAYLAGGSDASEPIVYRTVNGGSSWQSVFLTNNNQNIKTGWSGDGGDRLWTYGEYALGLAVAPNDPNRAAITDLGFTHVTADGGASWKQAYVASQYQNPAGAPTPTGRAYAGIGLENTTCWRVAWADSMNMISCFSDIKGIISSDAGATWSMNYTGHTMNSMYYALKSPSGGTVYAATSSVHDMYQSTYLLDSRIDGGKGQVLFSTDRGHTWQLLHDFGHPVIWLAADPGDPKKLYASVIHSTEGGIYMSSNVDQGAASTWTKLASPPRTQGHPFNIHVLNDGTLLCTYSGRRAGSPAAFTSSSGVFISTDGGTSWTDRSSPEMLYWTKDVVVDPHDPAQNTWYVGVFSGYGGNGASNNVGGLYRTTDRGVTWKILLDLPSRVSNLNRVTSCAVSPTNGDEMYVTTETDGLWHTSDLHATTPTFTQVAGYPFRQPERVFYNPYRPDEFWVTSFGNGMRVGGSSVVQLPSAPFLVSPANDSTGVPTSRSLWWNPVAGATSYNVQLWKMNPDSVPVLDQFGVSGATQAFTGLAIDTRYGWHVRASNSAGFGPWSETWYFRTVASSSVEEDRSMELHYSVSAGSTAGEGVIRYRLPQRAHVDLVLFDPLGRQAVTLLDAEQEGGEHFLRFTVGTSGVYLCRLRVDGSAMTRRIIVAR
jgi:photosystem II stability/assembly factor-like uncharacterized protein